MVEPRKRVRPRPQPEEDAQARVLPREKPGAATTQPAAPEPQEAQIGDPQVTGSIDRTPAALQKAEPEVAAKSTEEGNGNRTKQMSCEAAAEIVSGFGFSDVKPTSCSGSIYDFAAVRDGGAYSVKVSATDGELSEVKKR